MAIITTFKSLTDIHINAAQKILSMQFPLIKGFQDTLLSQNNMFAPIPAQSKGIQIHHVRNNHWITSCSTSGCVEVFDSIYDNLSSDLEIQLAMIYKPMARHNILKVRLHQCQHQIGSTDCGLFAIAWATELASGKRPEDTTFNQTKMRTHFLECLCRRKMDRFPQIHNAKRNRKNEPSIIELNCELH